MTFLGLLRAFVSARWLPYSLTVLLMALGVTTILLLLSSESALKEQFLKDAAGVDLVVGAKGSPLQLVLSSLYHADLPTGNIRISDAQSLCHHRDIASCVQLALGDTYQGFRIVGLDIATRDWGLGISEDGIRTLPPNVLPLKPLQALIGHEVARQTGLQIGNRFVGSHGLAGDGHHHDALPYNVVGILPQTGTVQDRLILTPVESVHKVHAEAGEQAAKEITALLIKVKSLRAVIGLPRWINANTPLMAAHPATEITRLYAMLGGGLDGLRGLSFAMIGAALLSLFIVLYTSLSARLPDLAMLRVVGWSRARIAGLMLAEGLGIALAGIMTGLLLALVALPWFAAFIGLPLVQLSARSVFSLSMLGVLAGVFSLSVLSCILPVWKVYRLSIARTLMRG
jgi:putative ABC transport system permease protein